MVKCVIWLFWTWLALKVVMVLFGRRAGREAEPTLRQKLLHGEPILFAVAFALAVPAALGSSWYVQHGYTRGLERAANCYGRLMALEELPDLRRKFDSYAIFQAIQMDERSAAIAGEALDLEPVRVTGMLADKMGFYKARYATLDEPGAQAGEAAAITRCLHEPALNF